MSISKGHNTKNITCVNNHFLKQKQKRVEVRKKNLGDQHLVYTYFLNNK